jgi:hypothetical protein
MGQDVEELFHCAIPKPETGSSLGAAQSSADWSFLGELWTAWIPPIVIPAMRLFHPQLSQVGLCVLPCVTCNQPRRLLVLPCLPAPRDISEIEKR